MVYDNIYQFLANYYPSNKHYTSEFDIKRIVNNLGIEDASKDELKELRNTVVKYYNEILDTEIYFDENNNYIGRSEKYYKYLESLQSVTTVIDHYIYKF